MRTPITLADVAQCTGGTVVGDRARSVVRLAAPDDVGPDALCVVWDARVLARLPQDVPVLAKPGAIAPGRDGVEVADPRGALVALGPLFRPPRAASPGVHPSACVDPAAHVDPAAWVGPLCVVSAGAVVEAGAVLEAQVFVGREVRVLADAWIEPLVALYDDTVVGRRSLIHSGAVIGCDGFGFIPDQEGRHHKLPQIGRVVIEDDVEIGALVTVDRATLGETRIGRGTKIDDHVHVAHNCRIGENCLLVAFTGLAGSASLGDGVVMAARSGVNPHVSVGARATVAGKGSVTTDVPPGAVVSGFPAQDHRDELRLQALVRKLPELFARVKKLEQPKP